MKRWIWIPEAALWLGYMTLIFVLSSRPMPAVLALPVTHIDKVYHLLGFAVLGALGAQVAGRFVSSAFWSLWLGAMAASVFGITDEWHQAFVPGRLSSVDDLLADISGAWLGAGLWTLWLRAHYERTLAALERFFSPPTPHDLPLNSNA